jgi:mannosyl-glycoprotein endo-beta-N-acetylglucosaminidase/stage II sporulation protein P
MAVDACISYPELYPSVLLAQAILESGNGNSSLAKHGNNHFGIKKGVGWTGDIIEMPTKEFLNGKWVTVNAPFRKYETVTESFKDRNAFLKRNPRYTKHGVFTVVSAEAQCQALLRAGYATDPAYADKLIALVDRYDLRRFDADLERAIEHIREVTPGPPDPIPTVIVPMNERVPMKPLPETNIDSTVTVAPSLDWVPETPQAPEPKRTLLQRLLDFIRGI